MKKEIYYGCHALPAQYKTFSGDRIIKPDVDGNIYYRIMNRAEEFTIQELSAICKEVFDILAPAFAPIQFVEATVETPNEIKIFNCPKDHSEQTTCPFHFDGKGGTLAHAFNNFAEDGLSRHLHIDEAEDLINEIDAVTLILHEVLHNLGFDHSEIRESVLYPLYEGVKKKLIQDDVDGINYLYGAEMQIIQDRIDAEEEPTIDDEIDGMNAANGCATAGLIAVGFWITFLTFLI